MASTVVCIEITDICTRVCEMEKGKKKPTIFKSLIFDNPKYSIDDGFIADRRAYGRELKAQLRRAKIPMNNLVFTLASNRIISREVTIPEMREDRIMDLIENERANYFPMDTSEHQFAYTVLERLKETKQIKILVFAAPSLLIQNYRALAIEQGFKIERLDYTGNSITQWLKRPEYRDKSIYLQINEKNSVLTIMDKGNFQLQRNMSFGYETCLNQGGGSEAIRPLAANLASVLEYYSAKNREMDINKIYVGGKGIQIEHLKELMEKEFNGLEIEIVEHIPELKIKKKNTLMLEQSTEFIACLGASENSINFYKLHKEKKLSNVVVRSVIAFAIVVAASTVIVLNGKQEYEEALKRQQDLKDKKAILLAEKIDVLENTTINNVTLLSELKSMDLTTHSSSDKWNDVIKALEDACVSNMVISTASSGNNSIMLNITVTSKTEAAKLIMQLKSIEYFSSVTTNSLTDSRSSADRAGTVTFSVLCTFKDETKSTKEQFMGETIDELGIDELPGFDVKQKMGVK